MNRKLEEFVSKCETCNTFQPAPQKEPLICNELPQQPWEKIACDIITYPQIPVHGRLLLGLLQDRWTEQDKDRSCSHWKDEETFRHPWNSRYIPEWQISAFAAMYDFEYIISSPIIRRVTGKWTCSEHIQEFDEESCQYQLRFSACPTLLAEYPNWRCEKITCTANVRKAYQSTVTDLERTLGTPFTQRCQREKAAKEKS